MNPFLILHRHLYTSLCRRYARRFVGDNPADNVLYVLRAFDFFLCHGYWGQLKSPRSFEEKLAARMLFDRNRLWTTLCDKWRVRAYVEERGCTQYLVPILWHGENSTDIPFGDLPNRFVLKATHGCGWNIIVSDKSLLVVKDAQRSLDNWLNRNYCSDTFTGTAWGYRNVRPMVLVEQFIGQDGNIPVDYKFFCFSGRAEYLLLSFDRYGSHSKVIVNRDFRPTDVQRGHRRYDGAISRPSNYETMLEVAETLAAGIDMIRIDLYNVEGRIYFGEMTCYPGGGMIPFEPRSEDFAWGAKWQLAPFVQPKAGHERDS